MKKINEKMIEFSGKKYSMSTLLEHCDTYDGRYKCCEILETLKSSAMERVKFKYSVRKNIFGSPSFYVNMCYMNDFHITHIKEWDEVSIREIIDGVAEQKNKEQEIKQEYKEVDLKVKNAFWNKRHPTKKR